MGRPALTLLLLPLLTGLRATDYFDDYLDSAPFVVVVEHEGGRRCLASLVSGRTAVTTAGCAAPASPGADVWALAAAFRGPPPRPRPAAAARRVTRLALAGDGGDPGDPALDLALLHLEGPFGDEAETKPIVLATERGRAENASWIYGLRAVPLGPEQMSLHVVNMTSAPPGRCAARVPQWGSAFPRPLCLTGVARAQLCEADVGGGVVCDGVLCGVVWRVGRGAGGGRRCSDVFGAHSIAHWRQFLRCAHTRRQCGRGVCSRVCREQLVGEVEEGEELAAEPMETIASSGRADLIPVVVTERKEDISVTSSVVNEERGPATSPRAQTSAAGSPTRTRISGRGEDTDGIHHRFVEFDPNRADFRVSPAQPPPVRLKAGEYGDTAAEYPAELPPPPAPRRTPVTAAAIAPLPPPSAAPRTHPPAPLVLRTTPRNVPAPTASPTAVVTAAASIGLHINLLMCFMSAINIYKVL